MKILYTPLMIVPAVSDADRARILEAAGPGSRFVEAREAARQQAEIPDTDVLFGRVPNDIYVRAKQLRELFEQTMGIVGFGGTGRDVAQRALAFGMRVLAVDIEDVPGMSGVTLWKADRLNDLLAESDVVVIALPLTKATHHLFTRDLFRRMRRHALLINVTRGAIVYGDDLLTALDEGVIGGAGIDVTDPEPLPAGHRLWTHPRAIVTPHTAGGSPRRAGRAIDTFIENLRRLRTGEPLLALIDKEKGY